MTAPKGEPDLRRMHEILRRRLTRRGFIRGAGVGVAGVSVASVLAACGEGTAAKKETWDPAKVFGGEPADTLNFANWPLYIDKAKDADGNVYYPSLKRFTEDTGIEVTYRESIQDNPVFFGKIQPQLQAEQPTGWDLIVMSNGWEFWVLVQRGWVYPLDTSKRPTFDQNAQDWAKDPMFDSGAEHSMAYQWGLTSIAVNHDLVSEPITKLDDLMDTEKLPPHSVGMLKDDMADFVMKNLGIDPPTSGPDEWKEAAAWLTKQRDSGVVRQYYSQGYADDMTAGNLSVTLAWSGDVLYYSVWGGYSNLEFIVPEGGCVRWCDNMMIPAFAANPAGALELMDFFYRPDIASGLQEWVLYMSPAVGTQQRFLDDAAKAEEKGWKGYANKLSTSAQSDLLFPSDEFLTNVTWMRQLKTQDEKDEWDSIFEPISTH